MATHPEPVGDAFQRAVEHSRRRQPVLQHKKAEEPPRPRLTVAISREAASGGRRVAQALAQRLGWPLYDRELVEKISHDSGVREDMLEEVDEHRSNFLLETLEAFTGARTLGGAGYAHRLGETLAGLGAHGECVIGRGAHAVLRVETTVSVRIVAALTRMIH